LLGVTRHLAAKVVKITNHEVELLVELLNLSLHGFPDGTRFLKPSINYLFERREALIQTDDIPGHRALLNLDRIYLSTQGLLLSADYINLGADGINLINACGASAWQTVFHFHIHVVPRYEDDPLKLPWIPEAGDSDEIAQIANRLRGEDG